VGEKERNRKPSEISVAGTKRQKGGNRLVSTRDIRKLSIEEIKGEREREGDRGEHGNKVHRQRGGALEANAEDKGGNKVEEKRSGELDRRGEGALGFNRGRGVGGGGGGGR